MPVEEFLARWELKERECGPEAISARMIPFGSAFLPNSAAPYLSFDAAANPAKIYDVYGASADWTDEDRVRLDSYLMIGTDGAGNPICWDGRAVVLLDHEDRFRTVQFVNSSVSQLCECLLAYMCEVDASRFRSAVGLVDAAALQHKSFWWHEAAALDGAA
jgi:hypothetical protein